MSDFKKDPLYLLRNKQPNDLQMHRWQVAVSSQFPASGNGSPNGLAWKNLLQLTAATCFGVVLGAFIFGGQVSQQQPQENTEMAYDDATMEVVYTKLD